VRHYATDCVLEHDEVRHQVKEPALVEAALQQHSQLSQRRRGVFAPGDRAPQLEPFLPVPSVPMRACTPSETTTSR
jgi:hypothetical protein